MQTRSQAIQDRRGSEVFTSDHFKSTFLSLLFFTDQSVKFRIFDFEWIAQCPFLVTFGNFSRCLWRHSWISNEVKKYETGFFIMTADDDVVVKLEQVLLRDGIFRRDQI